MSHLVALALNGNGHVTIWHISPQSIESADFAGLPQPKGLEICGNGYVNLWHTSISPQCTGSQ